MEEANKFLHCSRTVRVLILHVGFHLGEGLSEALRAEDRVVPKTLCATPLSSDYTIDNTFEKLFPTLPAESYSCAEASLTILHPF